ncbi:hypothetical protein TNCV_3056501 [Trichonephila clavipes]|nr:hypothetical protein TNCV_3056501 [Trichonephila clavipes]
MKSAFHLVRAIMYVSQPKSSCDKDPDIPDNLMNLEQWSHFHINRPLHPHNIASLCTLFPGGIEKLLWEQARWKLREKFACVIEREISAFLHKFLEESRGSRTRQKNDVDLALSPRFHQVLLESPTITNKIDRLNINVALFSCTRAFDDGSRNFEPWSSDVDDT